MIEKKKIKIKIQVVTGIFLRVYVAAGQAIEFWLLKTSITNWPTRYKRKIPASWKDINTLNYFFSRK